MYIEWSEPWVKIEENACMFETELKTEVGQNHILFGLICKCIARREDRDDVLFYVECAEFSFAVVHLTFSLKKEIDCSFPRTTTYVDLAEFIDKRMKRDIEEYGGNKL